MLTVTVPGQPSITIPTYDPAMPCWRFLKEHFAPTLSQTICPGYRLQDDGNTLNFRIIGKGGLEFTFENRLRPLKDLADDGGTLHCILAYGHNTGAYRGNAGPTGGSLECSICMDAGQSTNVCLSCLHRFHATCLADYFGKTSNFTCPNCRKEVDTRDLFMVKHWVEHPMRRGRRSVEEGGATPAAKRRK